MLILPPAAWESKYCVQFFACLGCDVTRSSIGWNVGYNVILCQSLGCWEQFQNEICVKILFTAFFFLKVSWNSYRFNKYLSWADWRQFWFCTKSHCQMSLQGWQHPGSFEGWGFFRATPRKATRLGRPPLTSCKLWVGFRRSSDIPWQEQVYWMDSGTSHNWTDNYIGQKSKAKNHKCKGLRN